MLFHYFSKGGDSDDNKFAALHQDLKKFGEAELDSSGSLKLNQFIDLFTLITKHSKKSVVSVKDAKRPERIQLLREGKEDEYKNLVIS